MTKDKALYSWFKAFTDAQTLGIYAETSVPETVSLPYMTYSYSSASMGDLQIDISVDLWMRTASEAKLNKVAEDFRKYVESHCSVACDEGVLYIYTGNPFFISSSSESDREIKLRKFNLTIDSCTA